MVRTRDEWVTYLQSLITAVDSRLDVNVGPVKDAFISPEATINADTDSEIDRVRKIVNVDNYALMTDTEFLAVLDNYLLSPIEGSRSNGVVYFQTSNLIADVNIPRGFPIATASESGVRIIFYTTEAKTMLASLAANYLNAEIGLYEIAVPVEAQISGDIGSVPAGTVTTMLRTIAGISRIENRSVFSPGRNPETKEESIARLKQFVRSSGNLAVRDGIMLKALDYTQSVVVVGSGDTGFSEENGRVDVNVIGQTAVQKSEFFRVGYAYTEDPGTGIVWIFASQPAIEIIQVLVDSVDQTAWFSLQKDAGPYSNSIYGRDALYISNPSLLNPYLGKSVEIIFQYNSFIDLLQGIFDDPDNRVFGREIVVREALQTLIKISVTLVYLSGYDQNSVKSAVKSAIISYVNSLDIGENLEIADVIFVIKGIPGVDNLTFTEFRRESETPGTVADIVAAVNEYFRTDTGRVTVS